MAAVTGSTFSGNSRDRDRDQSSFGPVTAAERAQRSVFVGNIPYEATEEQLKEIFCQVGPVVSFRLVYDRETGKPKGYGFCEYQDVETARSAMRNLNNHDFNGRPLRVGVAAGEQGKDDKSMQQALGGISMESPYGDPVEPAKAPEAISKAVASLPPEQMFELMKQMKLCIQNNPNEARNMLLQNPQLAYALLQAQIVMKIVDPQVALAMLHRQTEQIPPLLPTDQNYKPAVSQDTDIRMMPSVVAGASSHAVGASPIIGQIGSAGTGPPERAQMPVPGVPMSVAGTAAIVDGVPTSISGQQLVGPAVSVGRPPVSVGVPIRTMAQVVGTLADPRIAPGVTSNVLAASMSPRPDVAPAPVARSRGLLGDAPGVPGPASGDVDFRDRGPALLDTPVIPGQAPPVRTGLPARAGPPTSRPGLPQEFVSSQGVPAADVGRVDPRSASRLETRDPRQADPRRNAPQTAAPGPSQRLQAPPSSSASNGAVSSQDQEKTALIMQVLQLTDEQIAMLPPDQRQSIIILKDQIARSAV